MICVNHPFKFSISSFKIGQVSHSTISSFSSKVLEIHNCSFTRDACYSFKDSKTLLRCRIYLSSFEIILFLREIFINHLEHQHAFLKIINVRPNHLPPSLYNFGASLSTYESLHHCLKLSQRRKSIHFLILPMLFFLQYLWKYCLSSRRTLLCLFRLRL